MSVATSDIWEAMSTARTIRRFTDEPVDDAVLARCLEAAAARAQGLGACLTSWGSYGGEQVLRDAVGVPEDWMIAGHIVVGWPKGKHGPVRRRPLAEVVNLDHWDQPYRQQEKRRP